MAHIVNPNVVRENFGHDRYRDTISLKPVAFKRNGIFRYMNTAFSQGTLAYPHEVRDAKLRMHVTDWGDRRIHPSGEEDVWFSIGRPYFRSAAGWQVVPVGSVAREANKLEFTNQWARLELLNAGHYVKLGMEFLEGYRPPNLQLAFPISASGLTRKDNVLLRKGVPVMFLRPMHVEDLDNPEDVRPVEHAYAWVEGQHYIVCQMPSLKGMTRPYLDPTLESQPDGTGGVDTQLLQDTPTSNWGSYAYLTIEDIAGAPPYSTGNSLVKFDLSTLDGVTVDSGSLKLYRGGTDACWDTKVISWYRILSANSGWTETGATWNTKDGADSWAGDTDEDGGNDAGCSESGTDFDSDYSARGTYSSNSGSTVGTEVSLTLDATEFEEMIANNYGGLLYSNTRYGPTWCSSDHATAAYRPKLTVEYIAADDAPPMWMMGMDLRLLN